MKACNVEIDQHPSAMPGLSG